MKHKTMHRLLSLLLVLSMCLGFTAPAQARGTGTPPALTVTQVDDAAVIAGLPGLETAEEETARFADTDMVRVSILLTGQTGLERASDLGISTAGIATISVIADYSEKLLSTQKDLAATISRQVLQGEELDVVWNLTMAANLISANVEYGQIEAIEALPGVEKVLVEPMYEPAVADTDMPINPNMATSSEMIGTASTYASGYTGAGRRIAVIDTGTDTDHQSFSGAGLDYSLSLLAQKAGKSTVEFIADLDLLDTEEIASVLSRLHVVEKMQDVTAEDLYLSTKLPFAFNYVDADLDVTHLNDASSEHGSHVAGIATANAYIPMADGTFANALELTRVQGVAPDAQLITMKVFGKSGGAHSSDYIAAAEDAVILGADVINLSLGSISPGFSDEALEYEEIFKGLQKSDAVVSISAGNSRNWAQFGYTGGYLFSDDVSLDTVTSPGSYTTAFTVASVDNTGFSNHYLLVDDQVVFYGESLAGFLQTEMRSMAGEQEYIFIDGYGTKEDFAAIQDALQGRIAVCSRGADISFEDKCTNAVNAGAAAVVIYDNQPGSIIYMDLSYYTKRNPAVFITQADGQLLREAAEPVYDENGKLLYLQGKLTVSAYAISTQEHPEYYTMSEFSSWGVPGSLELKPEITAPGGNIYSVNGKHSVLSSWLGGSDMYENMSGTSMAAPQVAGMAALVAQYLEESGKGEAIGLRPRVLAQSLLMSTAEPMLEESTGTYYSIMRQGSGLANVGAAVTADSYILMGHDATEMYADGKVKAELGDDPERTGQYSFTFSIHNMTDEPRTFVLGADFFTQNLFTDQLEEGGQSYIFLDTGATRLNTAVTWEANGKTLLAVESLNGLDFDGNGIVDENDGQAILDYTTGLRQELANTNRADMDADGDIDTYDAYLFFDRYNTGALVVPADGETQVRVTISLTEAQKELLDANYENGAYVEGYIFAESVATEEGVLGTRHSIPVLAFYGDWTDPDMLEEGQYEEYVTGDRTEPLYMGEFGTNFLGVNYGGNTREEFLFGGNPIASDDHYMPERNAINSSGEDALAKIHFSLIRNAAATRITVSNMDTGEILTQKLPGAFFSGHYYTGGGYWELPRQSYNVNWNPRGLAEDTHVEFCMEFAPEYSLQADGTVDWEALGKGTELRIPMVIDNTAPTLENVSLGLMNETLIVTASDNQYIAGVCLYDGSGQRLLASVGAKQDITPGETATWEIPVAGIGGSSFYVKVVDYASNASTYLIEQSISQTVELPERMFFSLGDYQWYEFSPSEPENYTHWLDHDSDLIYWAGTMVDNMIYVMDNYGQLRIIDAVETYKDYLVGNTGCAMSDLAYNKADGCLYGVNYKSSWDTPECGDLYRVDMYTGQIEKLGAIGVLATTLACDAKGNFYCNNHATGEVYTFTLDTLGSPRKLMEVEDMYSTSVQSMEYDHNTNQICWITYSFNMNGASSPTAYIEINADTGDYTRTDFINRQQFSCLLIPEIGVTNGSWTNPTDEVIEMTLSDTQRDMLKGSYFRLDTLLRPWNLSDRSLIYTTSDSSVAVVDETGMVTAVGDGEAVITVCCPVDPDAVRTCNVTVTTADATVKGILRDADGKAKLFTWDLKNHDTWTEGIEIDTGFIASAYNPQQDVFYVMNDTVNEWNIHVVDAGTGKTKEVYTNTFGGHLNDMVYSEYYSTQDDPKIFAVKDTAVYGFSSPDNWQLEGYDLYSKFGYYGASYLVAVASAGTGSYFGMPAEIIYALDNVGNIWQLTFYVSGNQGHVTYSVYTTNLADLDAWAEFDPNGISNYSSMVYADDGSLYLSMYNGKTNDIYHLGCVGNTRTYRASWLADMGQGVFPASLYSAEVDGAEADTDMLTITQRLPELEPMAQTTADSQQTIAPTSDHEVTDHETTITLNVTAKDGQGEDVSATNGLITVEYDADKLTLEGLDAYSDYYAVNTRETGKVTFAYVEPAGAQAGEVLATLTFTRNEGTAADGNIYVAHHQVNDMESAYMEILTVNYEHSNTETRNAKEATCTEDGYTGDIYCLDCGALITQGEVIPAYCPTADYTDVPLNAWYHEAVDYVVENGIMEGTGKGIFAPEDTTTRAQMVTVLYRLEGAPEVEMTEQFADVTESQWYAKAVAWAYANGITTGVTETAFAPNAAVTREQVVVFLARYAEFKGIDTTSAYDISDFADAATVKEYAVPAFRWVVENGIINGMDGLLAPATTSARAQVAAILMRFIELGQ